jgi:hypothetical protein
VTAAVCGALNPEVAVADVAHIALLSGDFEVKLTRDRDASQLRDDDDIVITLREGSTYAPAPQTTAAAATGLESRKFHFESCFVCIIRSDLTCCCSCSPGLAFPDSNEYRTSQYSGSASTK